MKWSKITILFHSLRPSSEGISSDRPVETVEVRQFCCISLVMLIILDAGYFVNITNLKCQRGLFVPLVLQFTSGNQSISSSLFSFRRQTSSSQLVRPLRYLLSSLVEPFKYCSGSPAPGENENSKFCVRK